MSNTQAQERALDDILRVAQRCGIARNNAWGISLNTPQEGK